MPTVSFYSVSERSTIAGRDGSEVIDTAIWESAIWEDLAKQQVLKQVQGCMKRHGLNVQQCKKQAAAKKKSSKTGCSRNGRCNLCLPVNTTMFAGQHGVLRIGKGRFSVGECCISHSRLLDELQSLPFVWQEPRHNFGKCICAALMMVRLKHASWKYLQTFIHTHPLPILT